MKSLLRFLVLSSGWFAHGAGLSGAQVVQRFDATLSRPVGYQYLLSLPRGYAEQPERRWPLILFLHGAGERGNDPWLVAKHGPPARVQGERTDAVARVLQDEFIIVSPQCPTEQWWDAAAVLALLDDVSARLRVDPARVILTGLSMGGYGTWDIGVRWPERFAALVPICGGGTDGVARSTAGERRAALRALPVRAFHGARDRVVVLAESERMIAALRAVGAVDVTLTVDPEAEHDSWSKPYADPALYAWMLERRRTVATGESRAP